VSKLRSLRLLVLLSACLAFVLTTAPADAARDSSRDAANDAPARVDIRRVRVVHAVETLKVAVRLDDYRGNRNGGLDSVIVYVDTDGVRVGPEFMVRVRGFRYYFLRMRHWRTLRSPYRSAPYTSGCTGLHFRYNFDLDRVTVSVPRTDRCLGRPRDVRVSAVAAHRRDTARPSYVEDYAPAERQFYDWVHQG
jgi:hypothetical protein